MKLIPLRGKHANGRCVKVSDEDYEYLSQWGWYAWPDTKNGKCYAGKHDKNHTRMHRLIMGTTNSKVLIDHIDGDGLNNQRENLRKSTPSQNQTNRKTWKHKYRCVYPNKGGWIAHCSINRKKYCKWFKCDTEAAIWYNQMALKYHGEFAVLNEIK